MAYAAVVSLKQTIHRLLNSPEILIVSSSREILGSASDEIKSLEEVLERRSDGKSKAFDGQIREAVHKLEDAFDFHVSKRFLSEYESHGDEQVRQETYSIAERHETGPSQEIPQRLVDGGSSSEGRMNARDRFHKLEERLHKLEERSEIHQDSSRILSMDLEEVKKMINSLDQTFVFLGLFEMLDGGSDRERSDACDALIRGRLHKLEERLRKLEDLSNQFLSQSKSHGDHEQVRQEETDCFAEMVALQENGQRLDDSSSSSSSSSSSNSSSCSSKPLERLSRSEERLHKLLERLEFHEDLLEVRQQINSIAATVALENYLWPFPGGSSSSSSDDEDKKAWDARINRRLHKLEDLLEFHEGFSHKLSLDLEELRQEIDSFAKTVKKIVEECDKESDNSLSEQDGDDDVSLSTDPVVEMVGMSPDDFTSIKNEVLERTRPDDFGVFSFVGKTGSGRTVVAKTVFEDIYINKEQSFDYGAWVTVGPKYQPKEILLAILDQMDNNRASNDELHVISEGDEKEIAEYLYSSLKGRRYIIVLDDVRDTQTWDLLKSSFPEQDNGSLVLLTTELEEVADSAKSFLTFGSSILDEQYTWDLLRGAVFGVEFCPPELEEAGKKIAENCKGLRLVLAKVVILLSKIEKKPENWNKLAADEENSIFTVEDEISEMCKIREEYMKLSNSGWDSYERGLKSGIVKTMFESSEATTGVKMQLSPRRFFHKMKIISFCGMAGIGKSTIVKRLYDDPSISSGFDHCAWVTLGPKYQSKEILIDILTQIYPDKDKRCLEGHAEMCTKLSNKKCLIVLDDVWNKEALHYLEESLPEVKGKVLVTTRLADVARFGDLDTCYEMRLLDKEESWCLFRQKVFAGELCPPTLEKVGKKIAENCEGLPLTIIMVANLLSKAKKTIEYWNEVAMEGSSIFLEVYDQISKRLLPSYKSLPQHLKSCFLYMGIFPQSYEIPTSKITKLWIVEGFLELEMSQTVEDFAKFCLKELIFRRLVTICELDGSNFVVKTCRLHSVFWHLSNSEAMKNKFFHSLNSYANSSRESIKSQRRLCIRNNILLGIKGAYSLMASISTARSLLCIGPPHQYPVPISFDLMLLRVLDAHTIRLYEFPVELVNLIHLRYLALSCNGELPSSISNLWNLQYLIVSRHLNIKFSRDSSHLPVQIWDMKKLIHLQITGSSLPNPSNSSLLPNLLTLLEVNAHCCTKDVFERIPNLKRLSIQIELEPDAVDPLSCFDHISQIYALESLKCVILNPDLKYEIVAPPIPHLSFPSYLRKLSLSGFGYPWEDMSKIASFPNLKVLKLRCYAFQGPKWVESCIFHKLEFLLIEDTDLVHWQINFPCFPELKCLYIKHCYKIEELPPHLLGSLEMVEVVDCNPFVVTWANQIKEGPKVSKLVHSSWDAAKRERRLPICFKR